MSEAEWRIHDDRDALAAAVAKDVAELMRDALDQRGQALLALAGGQTPWAVYRRLASQALGWNRVTIIPGDERCVAHDDPLSNYGALRRVLGATGADIRPLESVSDLPAWPLDLVWLGMGADGHTASIFPGPDLEPALTSAERTVTVLPDPLPPEAPVSRLTLTRTAILAARAIRLVVTGHDKKAIALSALAQGEHSPFPIGKVLAAAPTPIIIHWCP